jgi:aspartyl-tRNA(Asn)/glutamyl-tRNA(Gln) amidotransferase subunit A
MHNLTLTELIIGLRSKKFSSVDLTRHFLERIRLLNSQYNAVITTTAANALEAAASADERLAKGNAPEMCGIPMLHKDIFCTSGVRTSCGSKMLDNFVPPYNATVVENFERDGAIMLGKTNMDEFAMGSSNETSFYGPVKNPWSTKCVPGGSSGGSAAAIAARLAPGATATDTGGSIRQPAALCGISGLKPTYGRVSRWGMIAFASSLDQAGPMARTAEDCAILLNCMASFDEKDSTSVNKTVPNYRDNLDNSLKGLKIGIPQQYFSEGLHPGTKEAVKKALTQLEEQGAELIEISLSSSHLSVPAYYVIAPAEASANLARFDGVKYGYRCENPKDLQDMYCRTRSEGFGEEVQRRILIGTYCLSAGYYDAYYGKAQQVRQVIQKDFSDAFESVDLIMGPTCPSPAFEFGAKGNDPVAMYLEDIYTIATNLAGLPGMSIPCGIVEDKPVGLQIIGNYFDEQRILNAAHQFQQITDWHTQAPEGLL